jgi:hypothetical protein
MCLSTSHSDAVSAGHYESTVLKSVHASRACRKHTPHMMIVCRIIADVSVQLNFETQDDDSMLMCLSKMLQLTPSCRLSNSQDDDSMPICLSTSHSDAVSAGN